MYRGCAILLLLDDCGYDEKMRGAGFGSSSQQTGFNLIVRVRVSACKVSKRWERLSGFLEWDDATFSSQARIANHSGRI